jgi:hypothetical protein
VLVGARASATREGGDLKLLHVTPRIPERLSISRLDSVPAQFDDEAAALGSYAQGGS